MHTHLLRFWLRFYLVRIDHTLKEYTQIDFIHFSGESPLIQSIPPLLTLSHFTIVV